MVPRWSLEALFVAIEDFGWVVFVKALLDAEGIAMGVDMYWGLPASEVSVVVGTQIRRVVVLEEDIAVVFDMHCIARTLHSYTDLITQLSY